jgi:hypothetical protein
MNRHFSAAFLILAFILTPSLFSAQTIDQLPANQPLSADQVREDMKVLQQQLKAVHGGVYSYCTETELDQFFAERLEQIKDDLRPLEVYRMVGPVLGLIKDAHTAMSLPDPFYEYLDSQMKLLPFGVRQLQGKLYLTINLSGKEGIPVGAEIVRINGRDVQEIFQELLPYFERDGKNLTGPSRELSNLFRDYYGFLVEEPEVFNLELRLADGTGQNLQVPAGRWPDIETRVDAYWEARFPNPVPRPPLSFKLEDGVGWLKIRTFHPGRIHNAKQKSAKFYQEAFEHMAESKVEQLVIDLRDNGGGSETEFIPLLRHILDQPFTVYSELSTAVQELSEPHLYPRDNLKKLNKAAKKTLVLRDGRYHEVGNPSTAPTAPVEVPFKGKVFVLINEKSASASGDFCGVLQHFDRAKFVGTETAGNANTNTAGTTVRLVLPHSKIEVVVPLLRYTIANDTDNEGLGVLPDYPVLPSARDITDGNDPVLLVVRKLLGLEK